MSELDLGNKNDATTPSSGRTAIFINEKGNPAVKDSKGNINDIGPARAAGFVSFFGKIEKGTGDTLNLPEGDINIGGNGQGYILQSQADWDPTANNDGTFSSLALGDDIYIYAVQNSSGVADWLASKNSTYPDGYDATNSRKVGGFHFGRVRTISQAYDSAASLSQQIVPNSCWDLEHRPKCDPTGMVEVIPDRVWVDIYLASEGAGTWPDLVPASEYNATPLSGAEGYARGLDYPRLARNAGKRLPTYEEFLQYAYGVPQGATGLSSRVNTGQHSDYGFECVSCLNVDQPSGNLRQQTSHIYDRDNSNDAWYDDLNAGKDGAENHGQWRGTEFKMATVGGGWSYAAEAGARCVTLYDIPWSVGDNGGLRAVCDSL